MKIELDLTKEEFYEVLDAIGWNVEKTVNLELFFS